MKDEHPLCNLILSEEESKICGESVSVDTAHRNCKLDTCFANENYRKFFACQSIRDFLFDCQRSGYSMESLKAMAVSECMIDKPCSELEKGQCAFGTCGKMFNGHICFCHKGYTGPKCDISVDI